MSVLQPREIGSVVALGCALLLSVPTAWAQSKSTAKKPPVKTAKPPVYATKGQGQLAGGNGQFGATYTLNNGLNFQILSAHYTLEPFNSYEGMTARTEEKLLVLDIAIKNANPDDFDFSWDSLFTFVDARGNLNSSVVGSLQSKGKDTSLLRLRPGQGLGQPALNDPLRVAVRLPLDSRIVKIMVNTGRKGTKEEVFRYYIAGATKAEAGEDGDPKNTIAPLPEPVRSPTDASGAVASAEGKGEMGRFLPSSMYGVRLDSVTYTTEAFPGDELPEGKRYAVATVVFKNLTDRKGVLFDALDRDNSRLYDTDGEYYGVVRVLKPKQAEEVDTGRELQPGDEYTCRMVFLVPMNATMKKLHLLATSGYPWGIEIK